jgi:homoserine dehydrogenase
MNYASITRNFHRPFLSRSIMSANHGQKILVAVVGCGLVGSEFIHQLLSIPPSVSPFKLVSLSSSKRTVFVHKTSPIGPNVDWKSLLATSPDWADLKQLTARLTQLIAEKERVALVDNTSSEEVAGLYPLWLKQGINIVTPNKKAFSGDAELFARILNASKKSGARFFFEATVGAGLPVIAPLKDLLATGDKVCRESQVDCQLLNIFYEYRSLRLKAFSPER